MTIVKAREITGITGIEKDNEREDYEGKKSQDRNKRRE